MAEQVQQWTDEARLVVGARRLDRLVHDCTNHPESTITADQVDVVDLACRVVRAVAEHRSTWTVWNVYAEAERQARPLRFEGTPGREEFADAVVALATSPAMSIRIREPELVREPDELVRTSDGQSVFVPHGSDRFTTSEILLAEDRLVDAGRTLDAPHLDPLVLEASLAIREGLVGMALDQGQRDLVEAFTTSPRRLAVGIGPAGSGKTTAMSAVADAWRANGGRMVALASSARAAQVLGSELDLRAENLHKFLYENNRPEGPGDDWFVLREGDLVLVDEAGMAGTLHLDQVVQLATIANASVRLLGDPAQLASVEAGGALRLLEREIGATHLTDLHRFIDPGEAAATLSLRAGEPSAIDFYEQHGRIRSGTRDAMLDAAFDAWTHDVATGLTSVLIAGSNHDVTALNLRARTERIAAGSVEPDGVGLRDGNEAGRGDVVVSRANARTLKVGRNGWVTNGELWQVEERHRDGSLGVRRLDGYGRTTLPAWYVADSLELGYATTIHRVQGMTADTAHALVSSDLSREGLYVASTRGRHGTTWYATTDQPVSLDCPAEPPGADTARVLLATILTRPHPALSARDTIRDALDESSTLPTLTGRYTHAWSNAARDLLSEATRTLPAQQRHELLNSPGTHHLACVLAFAVAKGAHPEQLLINAIASEITNKRRLRAFDVADRIEGYRHVPGTTSDTTAGYPLPWLPPPGIGRFDWSPYLAERARLIASRAEHLGSIAAAYREQHGVRDASQALSAPHLRSSPRGHAGLTPDAARSSGEASATTVEPPPENERSHYVESVRQQAHRGRGR